LPSFVPFEQVLAAAHESLLQRKLRQSLLSLQSQP
jgi:hypothetical protein